MGEYMSDVDFRTVEVHGRDQAILVTAYVEDDEVSDIVGTWKRGSQVVERCEIGSLYNLEPSYECDFAIWMSQPEFP